MLWIGIDTGTHTGVAIWDSVGRNFLSIETMPIHKALALVEDAAAQAKNVGIMVLFEDARQRKWYGERSDAKLQGAGSVKRDSAIWEDFLKDKKIPYRAMPPAKGCTKTSSFVFKSITGYLGRTSEHSRDAAMMVFGR